MNKPDPGVDAVRKSLERVVDPCSIATGMPITINDMGLVRSVWRDGGDIVVTLRLTSPFCMQSGNIATRIEEVTSSLPNIPGVRLEFDPTDDWLPDQMAPAARDRLRRVRPFPVSTVHSGEDTRQIR